MRSEATQKLLEIQIKIPPCIIIYINKACAYNSSNMVMVCEGIKHNVGIEEAFMVGTC